MSVKWLVYSKVSMAEARRHGTKVIATKWVDTSKGSAEEANYRSRLVGRELNLAGRPDLFAAPTGKLDISSVDVPLLKTCNGPTGS